jgi:ribonuclease HII
VVATAVILPEASIPALLAAGLTDSKKLSAKQRDRLDLLIRDRATACHLGLASVAEIDRINILQASLRAMARAIAKVDWAGLGNPELSQVLCLVDGNQRIPGLALPQRTVVGGDSLEPAIAAASIVAKVWRDRLMQRLALRYPGYGLEHHKGYGTVLHREGLAALGPSDQHRMSFGPCAVSQPEQLGLDL